MPRMVVGLVKTTDQTSTAENQNVEMAPSLDEADAILARFGYEGAVEQMALAV